MKKLRDFQINELEDKCDMIFAISGLDGVRIYLTLVEKRKWIFSRDPKDAEEAIEYRKVLFEKYKKIKL